MFKKIWDIVKSQSAVWFSTAFLGLLTVFSETITDHIKTGLNNADARQKCYEKMSQDFSGLIFNAESSVDSYNQAFEDTTANSTISTGFLQAMVNEYNASITTVRDNQYAYKYQLNTYAKWKWLIFKTDVTEKYDSLFYYVEQLDSAIHKMNPIATRIATVIQNKGTTYTLQHQDSALLKIYLPKVDSCLKQTKYHAQEFFNSL